MNTEAQNNAAPGAQPSLAVDDDIKTLAGPQKTMSFN